MRLTWLLCAALLAGCAEATVPRAVGGKILHGRFISARAYALYAIGADAEAHGQLETALAAYERAQQSDEESPEIWTRLGAVRCRLGAAGAAGAFERALALDGAYEPAYREQARCDLASNRPEEALRRVEEAILLDPEREDGILLRVEILRKLGRTGDAHLSLKALAVRRPRAVEAWRALEEVARQRGDARGAEEAARRLRELTSRPGDGLERRTRGPEPLSELDEALAAGQLGRARRLALDVRLPPAELAVRAAALGRTEEARDQAELVAGADPASGSALVALAVAAELGGDEAALTSACDALLAPRSERLGPLVPPSPLARLLLAELLARRVGPEAAVAWLGPPSEVAAGGQDPLERRVDQRVRARLALSPARAGEVHRGP